MTTGEWLVVVGTALQLGSIAVLVRWGYLLIERLTRKRAPTLRIHSVALTSGDLAYLKQKAVYHDQDIKHLQQAVRQLNERTAQPGRLELVSAGVLTAGTALNLAGAVMLALQQ